MYILIYLKLLVVAVFYKESYCFLQIIRSYNDNLINVKLISSATVSQEGHSFSMYAKFFPP